MLSAFTARPIIELRDRDKSKIETIVAYGDRVLVGLNSGALRIYRLNQPTITENGSTTDPGGNDGERQATSASNSAASSTKPTDLLREVERFSTRSIDQLAIIKEANTIVSLSNYHVSLHDLQSYELIETLSRTKNASCFAVTSNIVKDADTGIPEIISRLAVAVKRRLLLWSWHESELDDEDVAEISLPETIRSATWASATKILCGMNGGYVMVDVVTHAMEDIVSPGSVAAAGGSQGSRFGAFSGAGMGYMGLGGYMPRPLATKLKDGEMLLARDINTLFVDDEGKALDRKQIPWQSAPESVGYSYPYILALLAPSKGSLEVRNPNSLSLLQNISLPGASQIHLPPPTVSLAHAGKGFHISSDRCVWKMGATDYDSQIDELIGSEHYDEAISILGMLEDALLRNKTETLREVKMRKAEVLFSKKDFRRSMDLFNEDDVHAPPERVLKHFPRRIAGDLSVWPEEEPEREEVGEDEGSGEEGNKAEEAEGQEENKEATKADATEKNTNGNSNSTGTRSNSPETPPAAPSSPGPGGALAKFFGGKRTLSDTQSIASSKRNSLEHDEAERVKAELAAAKPRPLDGKDLTSAVIELISYLAGTRARLQRVIDPVTGKLKRSSNFDQKKANGTGLSRDDEDAEKLLRLTPTDSEKQQEQELVSTFRLVDTTLFRAYMLSRPTLAGPLFRIPNFCDPDVVNELLLEKKSFTELVDFFYGKKLHKEALELLRRFGTSAHPDPAAPALHGPDRAIRYLQSLPPSEIDLTLEHAAWTLKANPDYAMEIFVGDTENAENLPRDKVVAFLRKQDTDLEMVYLAHIIDELGDLTPEFHNRLVELSVQRIRGMDRDGDEGKWDDEMDKFLAFLRQSSQYSLSKAFGLIPRDDAGFYEAQAIVLSNMGQHKQALEIYAFKMKDYSKAEEYCNRVSLLTDEEASKTESGAGRDNDGGAGETPTIYHTLLSLYLQPPRPHEKEPKLGPALDLLSRHGSRLPENSTLGLIPDDLPVGALESYFRGRIRSVNSLVNESRIAAAMRKSESISVAARLHLGDDKGWGQNPSQGGRSRHVTITDERHCVVCHKKLGGGMRLGGGAGSVVAVLADNTVVHYGCLGRATGQRGENAAARVPSWGRGF
ncbi:Vam6/Vps39-like protein vacuolar protein sorting-associated protein 39 [Geosmithia morbida]|uniref:Vam6/Vps39-like protein vacuolar protein sorting-associated protein 39 n=1 Tax=Geosmithia morbida TaxID=1094350 RepID=A0A9P4YSC6_9HYPO|nr:Vam6/Vps39-like protein vacuolar protein sorting-associated protein 39 [Geosmithia morbida]KAF4121632.1 Vam6/Vps39-like protein vacuolar protein sorting-associated protein 39 [Geosmithia morbida]